MTTTTAQGTQPSPPPGTPRRGRGMLAMLAHPRGLWRFLRDRDAPRAPKVVALLALLYVVFPFDAVPDVAALVGWLDDLGLSALALAYVASQAARYADRQLPAEGAPADQG